MYPQLGMDGGVPKQGSLTGTVNSTSVSWTRIPSDDMKSFAMCVWAEVRGMGPEPYAEFHDRTLRSLGILYGYYTDGPSVRYILKKREKCFVE